MLRTAFVARILFFLLSFEIALALVLSAPEENPSNRKEQAAPSAPETATGGVAPSGSRNTSLFTGEFWEAGMDPDAPPEIETYAPPPEEETGILEPADPGNPRNPVTGAAFTNRQMQRFDEVNRRFPGNTLVPRRRSTVRKLMQAESKIVSLERQAQRGAATPEQIDQVYRFYLERENANIRLLEYLKNFAETKEQQARHQWLQQRSIQSLERRREQRERLIERRERIIAEREGE